MAGRRDTRGRAAWGVIGGIAAVGAIVVFVAVWGVIAVRTIIRALIYVDLLGSRQRVYVSYCEDVQDRFGTGRVCHAVWEDRAGRTHWTSDVPGPAGRERTVRIWHGITDQYGVLPLLAVLIGGAILAGTVLVRRERSRWQRLADHEAAWWPAVPGAAEAVLLDAIDAVHPGANRIDKRLALAYVRREWALRHVLPLEVVIRLDGHTPDGMGDVYELPWPIDLGDRAHRRALRAEARRAGVPGLDGRLADEKRRYKRAANARQVIRRQSAQEGGARTGLGVPPDYPSG